MSSSTRLAALVLLLVLGTAAICDSTSFGVITNTRTANNVPGIGAGEPRNVQLAMKVIF